MGVTQQCHSSIIKCDHIRLEKSTKINQMRNKRIVHDEKTITKADDHLHLNKGKASQNSVLEAIEIFLFCFLCKQTRMTSKLIEK